MAKPDRTIIDENRVIIHYRNDSIVVPSPSQIARQPPGGRRRSITAYSQKSRQRLTFLLNNATPPFTDLLTLTMPPDVSSVLSDLGKHRASLKSLLQRLRRSGISQYCWVREYTKKDALHWHIFLAGNLFDGRPDIESSRFYSKAWHAIVARYHSVPDSMSIVSARAESLSKPAGAYAAKEGSKHVQKDNKDGTGMAWWRCSRGIVCKPVGEEIVSQSSLAGFVVNGDYGKIRIPYRVQFGRGKQRN